MNSYESWWKKQAKTGTNSLAVHDPQRGTQRSSGVCLSDPWSLMSVLPQHPFHEPLGVARNLKDACFAESELLSWYVEELHHLCVSLQSSVDHEALGLVRRPWPGMLQILPVLLVLVSMIGSGFSCLILSTDVPLMQIRLDLCWWVYLDCLRCWLGSIWLL